MNEMVCFLIALFFALMYWRLKRNRGRWILLLFAVFCVPVFVAYENKFILNVPLAYVMLCAWTAGLIVPWYVWKQKGIALLYALFDLISWPAVFVTGIGHGVSVSYVLIMILFLLLMGVNVFLLIKVWKGSATKN